MASSDERALSRSNAARRRTTACVSAAAALVAATLTGGCYRYRLVSHAEIEPRDRVRVTVTPEQSRELTESLPLLGERFTATYLEGGGERGYLFSVPAPGSARTATGTSLISRVAVRPEGLLALEARELSRWRSAFLAGLVTSVVSTAVLVGFSGEDATIAEKRGEVDAALARWRLPVR